MENNEITITHLVNPHFFFFRWVKDEDFDEELRNLENKIENIALKSNVSNVSNVPDVDSKVSITNSQVVAVYVPQFHKHIRAAVKEKVNDDLYCVWAIDYGFPIMAKRSHIYKLPRSFTGTQLKKKRILQGGIENVMPAEMTYDYDAKCGVKEVIPNWSEKAIDLLKDILKTAVKIKFEHVMESSRLKKPHYFGRVMIQRPDNQMVNVVKCLLDMNYACLTEGIFTDEIKTIDTLKQNIWTSADGKLLDSSVTVAPIVKLEKRAVCADTEFDEEEIDIEDNMSDCTELNEYFDDSVSMVPRSTSCNNELQTKFEPSVMNGIKPIPGGSDKSSQNADTHVSNSSHQASGTCQQNDSRNTPPDRKANNNGMQKDQRQSNDQFQNHFNQKPQRFQPQRGPFPNPQANNFNRPPLQFNQLNEPPFQFNQLLNHFNQPPNQFNRQQGGSDLRRNGRRRGNRNRNNGFGNEFGDGSFAASIGHRPLERINESGPMGLPLMNMPPRGNLQFNPVFRSAPVPMNEYNHRNAPNQRRNNNKNNRKKNALNKCDTEENRNKNAANSLNVQQTDNENNELKKTMEMKIKSDTDDNQTESNKQGPRSDSSACATIKADPSVKVKPSNLNENE